MSYLPYITPYSILISVIPIPIFWYFFRLRFISLFLGIVALFIAYFMELGEEMLLGAGSLMLMLVFLAPVIEELCKFLMTYYKKDIKASIGVGLGFATIENAMYYSSLSPIVSLSTLFAFREFQDPILHSTTTSVSVRTWKKGYPFIIISIGMHSLYNIVSIYNNLLYMIVISLAYLSILIFLFIKSKNKNNT